MNPMFSIVVPVYNAEKYLRKCLNSLANQTYTNFEVILVNDGSRDNSKKICEEYVEDARFKLVNKENGGVSSARNEGINKAQGEYVIFVDSDDFVSANMCEEYARVLEEKKYDIIISDIEKVDINENYVSSYCDVIQNGVLEKKIFRDNFNCIYPKGVLNSPCSRCYKRNKIINLYDNNLSLGEDLIFNLNYIVNCEDIYFLNKKLYKYILYGQNSLSTKFREDSFENISVVYKKSIELLKKYFDKDEKYFSSVHTKYILDCLVTLERISRNSNFNAHLKIEKISKNYIKYLDGYNFEMGLIVGLKWKIYYWLLKKRRYKLFFYLSNYIKRRK